MLNIVDHRSTTSPGFYLHEGTLQSVADQFDLNTANWALSVPGVSTGLPFRLAVTRAALFPSTSTGVPAAGDFIQEDIPVQWALDIEVNPIVVIIPGLNAATVVGNDPMKTPSLQPVSGGPAARRVTLRASCVLRISGGPGGTQVQLVDAPDPLDPNAPSGATVRAAMQPNTAVFGNSQFGMKLDTLVADLSRGFTPAEIEARGKDETFLGMSLKELTFFLPLNTPLVDNLTLSGRDLLIGSPFGMQGEIAADFSKDFPDTLNSYMTIEQFAGQGQSPATLTGSQKTANPPLFEYPVATDNNARLRRVRAVFDIDQAAIDGVPDTKVVGVWWEIPGGTEGNSAETPWFDAPTDAVLRYRLRIVDATLVGQPAAQPALPSAIPDGQTELQQVTVTFPRQAGSLSGTPPIIDCTVGGGSPHHNVLHLRGPAHLLRTVNLETRGQAIAVRWTLGGGSAPVVVRSAPAFSLAALPSGNGPFELLATDDNGDPADTKGVRRIRIDVTPAGPLAIGHQENTSPTSLGLVSLEGASAPLQPTRVSDTFLAREYHTTGARSTAPVPAALQGAKVKTDKGTDAEVEVAIPSGDNQPVPVVQPAAYVTRSVQVLFEYGEDTPISVKREDEHVTSAPPGQSLQKHQSLAYPMAINFMGRNGPAGTTLEQQIAAWIAELEQQSPGADRSYYVVGRTDDLWYGVNATTNQQKNDALATQRKQRAMNAVLQVVGNPAKVMGRRETESPSGWPTAAQGAPARMLEVRRLALPPGNAPDGQPYLETGPNGAPVWRHDWTRDATDNVTTGQHALAKADLDRAGYRCAEVFAIEPGQQPQPPPPNLGGRASLVTMLVPGEDGPITQLVVATPKGANKDYRISTRVRWDSPSATGPADFIPTLAEARVRWKPTNSTLPSVGGNPPPTVASTQQTGPNYWEVLLNWAYDATTGQTEATGSLSVPHGKLQLISDVWASGLAFGPALAAKLDEADITGSEAGDFVGGLACIAAGAVIGLFINKDAAAGDHHGSVIFDKFTLSYKWNGAPHAAATTDYTVDLRINTGIANVFTVKGNLKMAYKGVGLIFDGDTTGGLKDISLGVKDLSVQVVDPGTWTLGGPLGNLIRIAASRMGNGSDWMEFDLEFAIDLGVVRLEGAVIRMRFENDPGKSSVELRGLTAVIEIPSTLTGKGSVTIGDGGAFRAMLGLEVIPAKLSAYGALAVDQDFVSIEVGIQLPVGIPLGGTGFGLFGFMGRFVANGTRDLSQCTHPDPVERQLQWYGLSPDKKYKRLSGQYAFGVGAVIGTLPDGGYSFNAEGALTLGFPDVSIVFSIDAHLITQRKSQATAQGSNNGSSTRILGMVVIEPDALMIAVRTTYKIPKLLELKVPISAYFPLAGNNQAWYIRIGSDNGPGRAGDPITLVLFPEVLDVKAWAFVMFEERELKGLGGTLIPSWANIPPLDFDGFSIGVGAGFDLHWSAGPFSLGISAFLVVGLGTKPLLCAGAAGVAGSLDLVVVTLDVNGWLYFRIEEGKDPFAKGHFCASIDCWLFTIEGCVDITIGNDSQATIPKPPAPISGMDLVDHLAIVKGKAKYNSAGDVPVVWPDTVGVLKFTHYIADAADSPTGFVRELASPAALSPWSGSNQLKYAYRLTGLELLKWDGAQWKHVDGPFDSVWWLPTHRAAVIEASPDGIPPSSEEGRELGLWTLDPAPWARWLTPESKDVPGNPVNTYGKLCDPVPEATPSCALGKDRVWVPDGFGAFQALPPPKATYPSKFKAVARLDGNKTLSELIALCSVAGFNYVPGAVAGLDSEVQHDAFKVDKGWRFPSFRKQGAMVCTVPLALALSKVLLEGELLLQVCTERTALPPPTRRVCDAMPARDGWIDTFTGASSAIYEGKMECVALGSERAVRLHSKMAGVHKEGAVDEVSVNLDPGKDSVLLTAFDGAGNVLARIQTRDPGRQWLELPAEGIVSIQLEATMGLLPITIYTVCWGSSGESGETGRVCDRMPEKEGDFGGFAGGSGARYEGKMHGGREKDEWHVQLFSRLMGSHAAATVPEVSVEVDPLDGYVMLVALDANGKVLTRVQSQPSGRQWLTLTHEGISQIFIDPNPETKPPLLYTVCWGAQTVRTTPLSLYDLIPVEASDTLAVIATDERGKQEVLEGEVLTLSRKLATRLPCGVLRYKLPRRSEGEAWTRIEIAPWYKGNVSLVALCGLTQEAWQAQQDDQAFKDSLTDLVLDQSQDVQDNQPTQHTWLDAASSYKLRVTWEYQGWKANNPGDDPPAPSSGGWLAGGVEEFAFNTAAFGVVNPNNLPSAQTTTLDMDPAQGGPGFDERTFDPRGLARYLTHTYPTHEDPPHFLDDPMGFWFRVNHLRSLVEKYDGRELKVKVHHTRPAPGSLHDYPGHVDGLRHILDVTLDDPTAANYIPNNPKWELTTDAWTVIDAQLEQVIEALPCINANPGSGASKVTVKADLEPNSEYDLLLNTVKPGDNKVKEVLVARSHFRTSRYHNPTGLLRALGFAADPDSSTPNDVITTFNLQGKYAAASDPVVSDTALDEALRLCGMDPWPIPPAPRTTVIWRQTGQANTPWEVAGVLLEADEPIWRAGTRTGALNEPEPAPRLEVAALEVYRTYEYSFLAGNQWQIGTKRERLGLALKEAVRNVAGTRLLFVAAATAPKPDATSRLFDIQLKFKEHGAAGASGITSIFNRPAIVAQEL
ncbi:hypothetical protein [Archangium violaceum]|uniref:hypothetical protein n=1 Tax=Archangium violaceum TaxID=83451 RepID=UPI0036DBDA79